MSTNAPLRRATVGFIALAAAALAAPVQAGDTPPITADEAKEIGLEAYLYLYPLISMDLTRRQTTNVEAGKEIGRGPMNTFSHVETYPPADFKTVVRPNFDTLYSSAWLDLTEGPVAVSAPDTDGRYYLLPMLDMWTDVFASPGSRTTGTGPGDFLVTPPGWTGEAPDGMVEIKAPTPYVWIIGRTKTDGPDDYDAVHKIQAGYRITPLSQWGKGEVVLPPLVVDPDVDMVTAPKIQADTMDAASYFAYGAELLKRIPPHLTDEPILARMAQIGLVPGAGFSLDAVDPVVAEALAEVPEEAQALMQWKTDRVATIVNGWTMNVETMGVWGSNYLKRAAMAQWGLGVNLPEDAIYPQEVADADGDPLDGAHSYMIHFDKAGLPPVNAFWSITLYDKDGFQVANQIDRFAISSWMKELQYNDDGSLDLYLQSGSPGADKESNWLPSPAEGEFNLLMRMYAPKPDVTNGRWEPPAVVRSKAP